MLKMKKTTVLPAFLPAWVIFVTIVFVSACQPEEPQSFVGNDVTTNATKNTEEIANTPSSEYQGADWTLNNQKDEPITLSSFKGRPTLLVFWATWCPYCKKLLPGIAELNDKYESKGLKVLGVNIKEDWKPKVYWRNFGYQFDTLLEGDEVSKIYGVSGTPTLVFIAPSGKVLGVKSFSDPKHPLLEKFAQEGIAMMEKTVDGAKP